MEELAIELLNTIRWIPIEERQGKTYIEYLNKLNQELIKTHEKGCI